MEEAGKEITPTGRQQPVEVSKLGNVIVIHGKRSIANGRWNTGLVADYVLEFASDKWMKVGEVARFAHFANNIPNKEKVRAHLSPLFREMLERSVFLAIEYNDSNNAASAIKVADLQIDHEKELVNKKIKRMKKTQELTWDQYHKSLELMKKTLER